MDSVFLFAFITNKAYIKRNAYYYPNFDTVIASWELYMWYAKPWGQGHHGHFAYQTETKTKRKYLKHFN